MQFNAQIEKTDKGFGIYFAKAVAPDGGCNLLAVDGFVEDPDARLGESQATVNKEALSSLQLGDVLIGVNGESCKGNEIGEILGLLRAAESGSNTLSFLRTVPIETLNNAKETTEMSTSGFMGALRKVKSKIRAEIDGDEAELLHEQLEDERFEKQWLDEFELLKKQYEVKWETCTYTADEFCGLLYRSSDAQQKDFLLQEYPTLMDAWKNPRASASSSRVIPEWPAVKFVYENSVTCDPAESSSTPRSIDCSQSLLETLECLRVGFMWRSDDLRAFSRRLDIDGISSCSALLEALNACSNFFERNFQSKEYPRLSKTMLRALRANTQKTLAINKKNGI